MALKKLFTVMVETEMIVWAESAQAAQRVAEQNIHEESSFSYSAHEVKSLRMLDADLADAIPWGWDGDDRTAREIMEFEVSAPTAPGHSRARTLPGVRQGTTVAASGQRSATTGEFEAIRTPPPIVPVGGEVVIDDEADTPPLEPVPVGTRVEEDIDAPTGFHQALVDKGHRDGDD